MIYDSPLRDALFKCCNFCVISRPKDLTIIKRHIENGTIRTTAEFQRDMMLMFTNAIMYNSSNHDVYKMAEEMYNDTMEQIEVPIFYCDAFCLT